MVKPYVTNWYITLPLSASSESKALITKKYASWDIMLSIVFNTFSAFSGEVSTFIYSEKSSIL